MLSKPTIDIIIPSFNGKYLLEKHLPQVMANSDHLGEVIVIDNGSTDDTISWLNTHFPSVKIVKNSTNLGFTKPINQGVAISHSDYFVLLNNDVHPEKGYLTNVLKYFTDEKVFAVSFNETSASWPVLVHKGKIQFTEGKDKTLPVFSGWASGGSAIYSRKIWDKIGGFNEIYAPYYWEDIDVGYRAWKLGYKVIWDPHSIVYHEHESTSKKVNQGYVSLIKQRNELLFNWINITDQNLKSSHLKWLITHTVTHPGYLKVVVAALIRFVLQSKPIKFIRTDKEVLSLVNKQIK